MYSRLRDAATEVGFKSELLSEIVSEEEYADLDYLRERAPKAFERTLHGVARVSSIISAMKAFSHPQNDKAPRRYQQRH